MYHGQLWYMHTINVSTIHHDNENGDRTEITIGENHITVQIFTENQTLLSHLSMREFRQLIAKDAAKRMNKPEEFLMNNPDRHC